jgi:hypothetical protein
MFIRYHTLLLAVLALALTAGNVFVIPPDYDENSVGADESHVLQDWFQMCGDLVDTNDEQTFFAPAAAAYLGDYTNNIVVGSDATCDTYDSEAEDATSNIALSADMPAFKVNGFYCITQSVNLTSPITFTLRSDGANTTPILSCTVEDDVNQAVSCGTVPGTTTDIAAGGTLSMQVDYGQDLDATAAWCKVFISIK